MKISKLLFGFMISCALVQYVTGFIAMATVITVVEVVEFAVAAISFIKALYDYLRPKTPLELCSASIDQSAIDQKVARNLPRVMSNIDDIKHLFLAKSLELERIMIYEHKKTEVWGEMMVFNEAIEKIRVIFIGLMQKLPTEPGQLFDMKEIYYYVLHYTRDNLLKESVDQLSDQVFPPLRSQESIVESLHKFFQDQKTEHNDCGLGQSPHEYLYSLYHETMTIEIEALVFHAFAYYFLHRYKDDIPGGYPFKDTPDDKLKVYTSEFSERIKRFSQTFTSAMATASRDIRPCDRDSITNENYKISHPIIELEGAIQYTINIKSLENIGLNIGKQVVFPRYCIGKETNCDKRTRPTKVCINPHGKKRYEWFIDATATEPRCNSRLKGTLEPSKFDIQVCLCNGNVPGENSTHIVNLRPVEADVYKNMVVTGIRFVVHRGVLHVQIQQGELQGNLKVKNVQWKPINDISHQVYQARRIHSYEPFQPEEPLLVEDVDFMVVKVDERDKINMEKMSVDKDYVLTGVKFDLDDKKRLQMAIIQTKFNITTGKLMKYCGKQLKQPANITRQRYPISNRLNTPAYKDFAPIDLPAQYVQFDASDVEADYGQTTIPFFDATEVTAIPPSPLGGAGLVFKTAQDYPGIISPILMSLDFSAYVDASVRDADEVIKGKMEDLRELLSTQRPGLPSSPAA